MDSEHGALEQAILDALDDEGAREPWLVYADWLQERGDPRGALIAAQAGGGDGADVLRAHAELVEPFGTGGELARYVAFRWHMGYWRWAAVGCDRSSAEDMPPGRSLDGILARLLAHPSARFLRKLDIGLPEDFTEGHADWRECVDTIAERVRPSIRSLFLGHYERSDIEISWTRIGDCGALWAALPDLTAFKAKGGSIRLGEIAAPKLRSLVLWSGGLPAEPVLAIGRATLPQLEELELWFGDDYYGAECTPEHLAGILDGGGLPALRRLGLMNGQFADALPALLAASPLLPRLESLDLSMGTMTDVGARTLIANAAKLRHLKSLSLAENGISDEVAAEIKAALPQAEIGAQKAGDNVYVSVGE